MLIGQTELAVSTIVDNDRVTLYLNSEGPQTIFSFPGSVPNAQCIFIYIVSTMYLPCQPLLKQVFLSIKALASIYTIEHPGQYLLLGVLSIICQSEARQITVQGALLFIDLEYVTIAILFEPKTNWVQKVVAIVPCSHKFASVSCMHVDI